MYAQDFAYRLITGDDPFVRAHRPETEAEYFTRIARTAAADGRRARRSRLLRRGR